ncbi:CALM [Lepeophtheirus salmonis]|nr:CALM [Lepeophtheirus salmonis]CAF2941090.1 CALM [Lepeophtheirus salmonis]
MLGRLLRQCGENPSESEIQDLINDVDSDASGFLHFPTFLNMMSKKYVELNAEDEIREAFKVFDSDGNGYITRRELKIVMMNMGEKLSDEEIESIIDDSDLDNDGQINYEEFYIMMNSVK